VLRRAAVPVVTDPAEAARRLELGMLSVMAHGETEQGTKIAGALLPVIAGLDEERSRFYFDLLVNSVNEATRRALEAMMKGYDQVTSVDNEPAGPRWPFGDVRGPLADARARAAGRRGPGP
jgi:hypothetical protein